MIEAGYLCAKTCECVYMGLWYVLARNSHKIFDKGLEEAQVIIHPGQKAIGISVG